MTLLLARNWWSLALRGAIAIIFGLITFAWPGITFAAMVFLFGGYALVDGVVNLIGMFHRSTARDRWWVLLLEGLAGIGAGLVTLFWPGITALALVIVIAAWAFVTGIFEIAAAIRLRNVISGEWLMILSGVISVILGILFAALPIVGALAIAITVGIYATVFGILMLSLGFRLRAWSHTLGAGAIPLPAR